MSLRYTFQALLKTRSAFPTTLSSQNTMRAFSQTLQFHSSTYIMSSTTNESGEVSAVDKDEMEYDDEDDGFQDIKYHFEPPMAASYFTGKPQFFDLVTGLDRCIEQYTPFEPFYANPIKGKISGWVKWHDPLKISETLKLPISKTEHHKIVARFNRLLGPQDNPHPLPMELVKYLNRFTSQDLTQKKEVKVNTVDSLGRAFAVGRRKTSAARSWVTPGEGLVHVNGKPISEYFTKLSDLDTALVPFHATSTFGKYNAWILALGGGTTGQSEAIKLALSRSIAIIDPTLKPTLRQTGCLDFDQRRVERKKTNRLKARKMRTWVKR
ncbi:ribosomal protein S5 domain 2-like protein [Conidiobolus coronatus NRRL 28638]|uniref:Small ribosomal subunit protein uS9m n=1 Tax=Conidiobolus coronatus (strain ATCC 28846 / CBS 209.66 / NRRL 28638) TaxID=796925 RepID=A0A137PAG5_CONC2|nr:ribosomal protein S5 domain 2-like protein [Conidiobolus coronatus NRRL 28638]|eukprot:KXN71975.1 ribosomal protein S5 domain 2-like protein [Conidiobolus coronatus NRRL 28638]